MNQTVYRQSLTSPDFYLLAALPKNVCSFICGWIVQRRWPEPINRWFNAAFVNLFNIDLSEAVVPEHGFQCIEDVFTAR